MALNTPTFYDSDCFTWDALRQRLASLGLHTNEFRTEARYCEPPPWTAAPSAANATYQKSIEVIVDLTASLQDVNKLLNIVDELRAQATELAALQKKLQVEAYTRDSSPSATLAYEKYQLLLGLAKENDC